MNAPYWFPAVTLALGAVGGFLADYLRAGRTVKLERTAASAAFQRESLIALQDWLGKLARAASQIYHVTEIEFRRSGQWGRSAVGDEPNEHFREAASQVHRYRVRVLDDEIRGQTMGLTKLCTDAILGAAGGESDGLARARSTEAWHQMPQDFDVVNERIGSALREVI